MTVKPSIYLDSVFNSVFDSTSTQPLVTVGPNVNITKLSGNQAESTISINPTNPLNLFESDTLSTQGHFSTDGGTTWQTSNMSALPPSIGDVQTTWDSFGNLFLTQLGPGLDIIVARSSDGGATFKDVRTVVTASSNQPSIAVGPSGVAGIPEAVWISVNSTGNAIVAAGAPVSGFDTVGAFGAPRNAARIQCRRLRQHRHRAQRAGDGQLPEQP